MKAYTVVWDWMSVFLHLLDRFLQQVLWEKLQFETQQADTLLQQVALLANVASPESLLSLAENGAQLQENISAVKDMIMLKREEAESTGKPQQVKYAKVKKSEDHHSQVTVQDPPPKDSDFSNAREQQGKSSSNAFSKAKELHEDSSAHEDFIKDLQDFKHLAEIIEDWLKILQQSVDTETDAQNLPAKTKERLQELKVKNA